MRKLIFSLMLGACLCEPLCGADYSRGVFIVNEDWYGHNNSTVNHLDPDEEDGDYWTYRVIRQENPGVEIGATCQFGAIYGGRFYIIAKQPKDPGAGITGGRITIADASDMKVLKQIETIDASGAQCDGRGFVGVNPAKGYVSSSNGVWVLDLGMMSVTGRVEGTENPFAGDGDMPVANPAGALYHGQCGTMAVSAGRVFVAHQGKGLLVVDPERDAVTEEIGIASVLEDAGLWTPDGSQAALIAAGTATADELGPGIGSVVRDRNGMLWLSVAEDVSGSGVPYPALICVDPVTLHAEAVPLPDDIPGPQSSWYAWTPDAFCASSVTDCLYWKGGATRWFGGSRIFRFDTVARKGSLVVDTMAASEGEWGIYGCSMRLHPVTDEIYVSLYKDFIDETYLLRRYTSAGVRIKDYPMISNYWFPALPVFPGSDESGGLTAPEQDAVMLTAYGGQVCIRHAGGETCGIYDLSGRKVAGFIVTSDVHCAALDLPPGVYVVRIKYSTFKILIN